MARIDKYIAKDYYIAKKRYRVKKLYSKFAILQVGDLGDFFSMNDEKQLKISPQDRAVMDVAELWFKRGEYKKAQETSFECLNSVDDRVKIRAAELIVKSNIELYKHLNPQTQKVSHEFESVIRVSIEESNPNAGN